MYMNKDDIFWFDVAMNDIVGVHVGDARGDFPHDDGSGLLRELPLLLHGFVELAITAEFHKKVKVNIIRKERI